MWNFPSPTKLWRDCKLLDPQDEGKYDNSEIGQFSMLTLISLSTSFILSGIWVFFFRMKKKNGTRTSPYFWPGLLGNNFCRVIARWVLCDIKESWEMNMACLVLGFLAWALWIQIIAGFTNITLLNHQWPPK